MSETSKILNQHWWGIIRFARDKNGEECAAFDGWYAKYQDAFLIYQDWRRSFPNWHIALVRQELTEIAPAADFGKIQAQEP